MTWDRMLTGEAERGELLGAGYRPIRRLSGAEAPIAGELAVAGDETVVLADVDGLADWPGWAHSASQHVYGVRDIVRRRGGHDAVLPRCARLLEPALARVELTGGEAVTLAVSLLRGAAEVRSATRDGGASPGAWWLLADGRPVFVPSMPDEAAGEDVAAAAARILAAIGETLDDRVVRRLLDEAGAVLDRWIPPGTEAEQLEDRLFGACAPRPLDRLLRDDDGGEESRAAIERAVPTRTRRELRAGRVQAARQLGAGGWSAGGSGGEPLRHRERMPRLDLREIIDAALAGRVADGVSHALARVRDGVRSVTSRRGAPLVLGGVAAAAVIVVGLMWPAGEPASAEAGGTVAPSADDERAATTPSAGAPKTAEEAGTNEDDDAESGSPEDPVAAGERLLDGLAVCAAAGDAECAAVRAPAAPPIAPAPGAAALLPAAERTISLLDEFGDIAVIQVAAIDASAGIMPQSVVLERPAAADARWMIRDLHDLAAVESTEPGNAEGAG